MFSTFLIALNKIDSYLSIPIKLILGFRLAVSIIKLPLPQPISIYSGLSSLKILFVITNSLLLIISLAFLIFLILILDTPLINFLFFIHILF